MPTLNHPENAHGQNGVPGHSRLSTSEIGKGTGQGLSVAHTVVVNKHGGTITVDSKLGSGTAFLIRLPIGGEDSAKEAVAA